MWVISGLYLEGGSWNGKHLVDPIPKELIVEMPRIALQPYHAVEPPKIDSDKFYNCPVYITQARKGPISTLGESENYLFSILLPTNQPEKHWIKRGTALFCQLNA
jgi:dynein heavy chain